MKKLTVVLLVLAPGAWGCNRQVPSAEEPVRETAMTDAGEVAAGSPAPKPSPPVWVYFFAAPDKASLEGVPGVKGRPLTRYRVEEVVPVRGMPGLTLKVGATLVRLETPDRLAPLKGAARTPLLLQGVTQHLHYTNEKHRDELARRSRAEIPPSPETVAVLIPVRKSAAWWALAQDQRQAHFQEITGPRGHTAVAIPYVDRVYRKLYHTRYAVEVADHDFLTYFEFRREHAGDFNSLLAKLRDPKQNPEWEHVDREWEIRMTKID